MYHNARPVHAYAAVDDTGIDVKTVSHTKLAAIVNWLVAGRSNLRHVMVMNTDSEAIIMAHWYKRHKDFKTEVQPVIITLEEQQQ